MEETNNRATNQPVNVDDSTEEIKTLQIFTGWLAQTYQTEEQSESPETNLIPF